MADARAWDPTVGGATAQQDTTENTAVALQQPKPLTVSGSQNRYRREFYTSTPSDWDVVVDPAMTLGQSGTSATVNMGTTTGKTSTLTCKKSFIPPFTTGFIFTVSQKIANNEIYFELVAENNDGTLDETTVFALKIAGSASVTATSFQTEVQNGGPARVTSAVLTGGASQVASTVYELVIETDEAWVHSKTPDSSTGRTTSYVRNTIAPDPSRRYRPRVRLVNNGTPASATTVTLSACFVSDFTEIQASVQGGPGSANAGQGVPVNVSNVPTVNATVVSTAIAALATVVGTSIAKVNSAATTNQTLLKATAGRLYGVHLYNTSATVRWLKLFNKATAPVTGTDTPVMVIPLPANAGVHFDLLVPASFATGLGYAITANAADLDNTAVAAGDIVGSLLWI